MWNTMKEEKTRKARMFEELDNQLASSELIRKNIPEGPKSMFRALSDRLLHDENQGTRLVQVCNQYFDECIKDQKLPHKLSHFSDNPGLTQDYKNNPDMNCFSKAHLQLISRFYSTRIQVYYLTDDMYLNCFAIDDHFKKTIHLCKVLNHYDPVYTKQHLDIYNSIKDFIYDKLKLNSEIVDKEQIDYIVERRPSQLIKRKHKKSLSACDQSDYKELEYNFENNNLIESNSKIEHLLDDEQEFNLIKECNVIERKRSLDKLDNSGRSHFYPVFNYDPKIGYPSFVPDYRMIQSERLINFPQEEALNNGSTSRRCQGRLKFFDENRNYGFIIMDEDNSQIFVHFDDLCKAGLNKEYLRTTKHGYVLRFEFQCMFYVGKYKNSRKAVDLVMLSGYIQPMY